MSASLSTDLEVLERLNDDYISSVRYPNAGRFAEILGDDFLCSLPDGSLIDRAAFLDRIAHAPAMTDLRVYEVMIRVLGDVAIVHARTSFSHPDGTPGSGRYTDVWARRDGHWLAVAAQFSRQ
jgi:ketosteroid isomerase-like protein